MIESFQGKQGFSPTQILTRFIAQLHLILFSNSILFFILGDKNQSLSFWFKITSHLTAFICMLQNTFYKKKSSMTVPLFRQFVPTINTKVLLLETKHFSDLSLLFWKSEALAFLLWCTFAFLWHVTFLLWILHLIEGAVIGSSRTKDFHPSLMIWSGDQKFITEGVSFGYKGCLPKFIL